MNINRKTENYENEIVQRSLISSCPCLRHGTTSAVGAMPVMLLLLSSTQEAIEQQFQTSIVNVSENHITKASFHTVLKNRTK